MRILLFKRVEAPQRKEDAIMNLGLSKSGPYLILVAPNENPKIYQLGSFGWGAPSQRRLGYGDYIKKIFRVANGYHIFTVGSGSFYMIAGGQLFEQKLSIPIMRPEIRTSFRDIKLSFKS